MAKKKIRIAGFEAGITKKESLEIFLTAIVVTFLIKLLQMFNLNFFGGYTFPFIILIAFPFSLFALKFLSSRKFLTKKEWIAGIGRGLLMFGLLFVFLVILGDRLTDINEFILGFLLAILAGIVAEFTIDPILGLD